METTHSVYYLRLGLKPLCMSGKWRKTGGWCGSEDEEVANVNGERRKVIISLKARGGEMMAWRFETQCILNVLQHVRVCQPASMTTSVSLQEEEEEERWDGGEGGTMGPEESMNYCQCEGHGNLWGKHCACLHVNKDSIEKDDWQPHA